MANMVKPCEKCAAWVYVEDMPIHLDWHANKTGRLPFSIPDDAHVVTHVEFVLKCDGNLETSDITDDWNEIQQMATEAVEDGEKDVTIFMRRKTIITEGWGEKR